MPRDLVIVGAGGFARETAQLVAELPEWHLFGFLDDDAGRHGTLVDGLPVLGDTKMLDTGELPSRRVSGVVGEERAGREANEKASATISTELPAARVVVCTGGPRDFGSRARIVARLGLPVARYATLVHPGAAVSRSSSLGPGSVLLAGVVLTAAVRVGAHVAVMPHVTLTHDCVVEDFVTIASGVRVGGSVRVESGAYLGSGALIREGRTIGRGALVGMGAVVTRDVPALEVWVGNPARFLRNVEDHTVGDHS